MKNLSNRTVNRIKRLVFAASLAPFLMLLFDGYADELGADPVAALTRVTGIWALNFLLLTLTVSPLRKYTGWNWLMRLRRILALFCFFYASLHVAIYLVFEQSFDGVEILRDVAKRPFITAGFAAFLLLVPLAITSTDSMMRRLGGRRWQNLHRLVYPGAIAAVLHYFWLVKRDITDPAIYAVLLCLLLCVRMAMRPRRRAAAVPGRVAEPPGFAGGGGAAAPRNRD